MLNGMISSISGAVNTTGSNLTVDSDAQFVSGADNNIAIGANALNSTTTNAADNNIGIGVDSLTLLTTGNKNTGIGTSALAEHTTGGSNIAIGSYAMYRSGGATTSGDSYHNTFIGVSAGGGDWVTGAATANNVSIGNNSMVGACNGATKNTCVGYGVGAAIIGGDNNCLFGYEAGVSITSGVGNTAIGYDTDCAATADNQIAIGNGVVTDGANKIRLGNSSISTCNIQVDWTVDSDVRIKKEIVDNTLGLSFINSLKPRKYKKLHPADWDKAIKEDRYKDGFRDKFDDEKIWDGLIAQEVKEAVDKAGVTFSGWEIDSKGKQGIQYSSLVVPLIKAVQELSQQIEDLKKG